MFKPASAGKEEKKIKQNRKLRNQIAYVSLNQERGLNESTKRQSINSFRIEKMGSIKLKAHTWNILSTW